MSRPQRGRGELRDQPQPTRSSPPASRRSVYAENEWIVVVRYV
ncbi:MULTISPECIES: hypothetical protein [unclassified Streptomyces]|nr:MULTISPECIES: hypothetical protein [unclassified Streptomyces]MCX5047918.1 hypothetical protein [Streptomyces sp. NBC_00474]MCX5057379.1 hypothetical protein [Streptomyces sp. NBC_00452]MCX5245745.1 hypothetical protein [Streptomyces sp. NBC_00201]MCX5288453.1 hypothetical protein [Streptomyces sp. NBC_00183]